MSPNERPIHKTEPLCYNSRDNLRRDGWADDDYEMEQGYESRGPNKDCACDVCFYGAREHWLAGFDAGVESTKPDAEPLPFPDTPHGCCGACGAMPGTKHDDRCLNLAHTMKLGH